MEVLNTFTLVGHCLQYKASLLVSKQSLHHFVKRNKKQLIRLNFIYNSMLAKYLEISVCCFRKKTIVLRRDFVYNDVLN